jgi:hypothetical protein
LAVGRAISPAYRKREPEIFFGSRRAAANEVAADFQRNLERHGQANYLIPYQKRRAPPGFDRRAFSFGRCKSAYPLYKPCSPREDTDQGAIMLLAKLTALAAVLLLGACTAIIDHPTPVATSQPQDPITPEIPNLKPFPPEEPPAVITASPEYGSAN